MLDLRNNSTAEGNQIQGYAPNGTVAQQVTIRVRTHFVTGSHTHHLYQWVIKRQNEPGSRNKSVTIQSNNSGNNGNGCFTASEVCWVTIRSSICLLVDADVGRIRMNRSFTPGRRLSSILLDARTILSRESPTLSNLFLLI
jgi:hypothetical protein